MPFVRLLHFFTSRPLKPVHTVGGGWEGAVCWSVSGMSRGVRGLSGRVSKREVGELTCVGERATFGSREDNLIRARRALLH